MFLGTLTPTHFLQLMSMQNALQKHAMTRRWWSANNFSYNSMDIFRIVDLASTPIIDSTSWNAMISLLTIQYANINMKLMLPAMLQIRPCSLSIISCLNVKEDSKAVAPMVIHGFIAFSWTCSLITPTGPKDNWNFGQVPLMSVFIVIF
jgi:hypothetical protein